MVRIITDSAADLEPIEYERLGVTCIPLTVLFGDNEYQENVNLSKDQFYDLLTDSGEFPRTSQPSPQTLVQIFDDIKRDGDEAVVITLSSRLSGTYQSTVMSKGLAGCDSGYVVDGRSATGGQRMLVEYAVKLRDMGKCAAEIAFELENIRSRVKIYACMDTLEYLYRGGRVSNIVYRVGSFANIKPIIHVSEEGTVEIPAKAMGMRKGIEFMCKRTIVQKPDENFPFYVMYTDNRTNALILAEQLRLQGLSIPDERIINVGAAIGSHIGPNACGIVYVTARNTE